MSALREFRGPLVPAGVLLGLGRGFPARDPLEPLDPELGHAAPRPRRGPPPRSASSTGRAGRERRPIAVVPAHRGRDRASPLVAEPADPDRPLRRAVAALAVRARRRRECSWSCRPSPRKRAAVGPSYEIQDLRRRFRRGPRAPAERRAAATEPRRREQDDRAPRRSRAQKNPVARRW